MKNLKQIKKEVGLIRDRLGKAVEEGIKELIIGLHCCGIPTKSSCGGHDNEGLPYPWVKISYDFAEKLAEVVGWQNRPKLPDGSDNKNTWVIKPTASLTLIPENKNLLLEELQENAREFGVFLQNLPPDWFPKGWFEK